MTTPKDMKIEKSSLTDEVYRRICSLILQGQWQEGEKIPGELQLSKMFNVSRAVIREALQMLRSEKKVVTRHGIGSFVANPDNYSQSAGRIELSEDTYDKMTVFRESVELTAIKLAGINSEEDDIQCLFDAIERMRSKSEDQERFSEADYEFHEALVRCSHNEFLLRAYKANKEQIIAVFMEMNRVPESRNFGLAVHQAIAEEIRDHRVRDAVVRMKKHDEYNRVRMAELGRRK